MMTLRALSQEQIEAVYRERMLLDFPKEELKPLQMIIRLYRKEVYDAFGAFDGDELVAYALAFRRKDGHAMLLDYLAVTPDKRGRGIGEEFLTLLAAHYGRTHDAMIIECEEPDTAPDSQQAAARLRFYERAGARMTDLRATLFGVMFVILYLPLSGNRVDCAEELTALYKAMLSPGRYAKWVDLRRTGMTAS